VKPVATLELLTENELVVEARTACRYLAVSHAIASQRAHLSDSALWLDAQSEQYQLALDYLSTISAVVQKLHNGTMPEWVNTMQAAVSNAEEKRCGDSVASPARE
jgi:hypothetical protein